MNKPLIESLAAKSLVYQDTGLADGRELVFNTQKFAELIVRECIEVGLEQKKWVEDQTVFNESDEVWNRARIQQSQHIVDKIKEHWGVDL